VITAIAGLAAKILQNYLSAFVETVLSTGELK